MEDRTLYKRILLRAVLAIIGVFSIIFVIPKAVSMLWPFVIALIVASIINPVTTIINRRFGLSRKIVAVILNLLIFLFVSSLLGFFIYSLINDVVALATNVQQNWDEIIGTFQAVEGKISGFTNILPPAVTEALSGFEENLASFLQNTSKSLLSAIAEGAQSFASKTGSFFINFIMYILASYFIISDYKSISVLSKRIVGNRLRKYFSILKTSAITALGGYAKSQLLLALFAFLFMLIALVIYGQPYALLIALFLGFIDLLPIVGTIAVLAPWGVIELISGNTNKGIFLIILGVVFFIIRKFVEPKIVGSQTGLHPLAALVSAYVGLKFSGVWGAVLGPVILMLIISIAKSGIFNNTVADLKEAASRISAALRRPVSSADKNKQDKILRKEY